MSDRDSIVAAFVAALITTDQSAKHTAIESTISTADHSAQSTAIKPTFGLTKLSALVTAIVVSDNAAFFTTNN